MASPGLCLRRPGALRPPVPQTGKVPAPGTVSSFLLRKKLETVGSIYQFICSIGHLPHRHVAGLVARAKRLARRRQPARASAQHPEPDRRSGRGVCEVWRPKAVRPACLPNGRLPPRKSPPPTRKPAAYRPTALEYGARRGGKADFSAALPNFFQLFLICLLAFT